MEEGVFYSCTVISGVPEEAVEELSGVLRTLVGALCRPIETKEASIEAVDSKIFITIESEDPDAAEVFQLLKQIIVETAELSGLESVLIADSAKDVN